MQPTLGPGVPAMVRDGYQQVASKDAKAHCASLTPEQAAAKNFTGCKWLHRPGDGATFGAIYVCNPCGECLWMPLCCCLGIPCPCALCACTGDRQANTWILRNKHGSTTGFLAIVDEERKTLAHYNVKCCSSEPKEYPDCYF